MNEGEVGGRKLENYNFARVYPKDSEARFAPEVSVCDWRGCLGVDVENWLKIIGFWV